MVSPVARRRVRTVQPTPGEALFIDWDNPITKDMTVCLMHADQAYGFVTAQDAGGFPTVTGNVPYTAGTQANTPQGTGGRPTGTARMYSLSSKGAINSPNYSLFALGTCTSLATTQSALDMDNSGPRYFQFRVDAGKVDFIPFNTSAATTGRATSTVAMTIAEMSRGFTIGATASPTRTAAFQNGVLTVGAAVANLATPGIDMPICVGARATNAQAWSTGALILVVIWTRTLSDMEMLLLSDNPWQLFKPRFRRWSMVDPSSAIAALTTDAITVVDLTTATYFSAAQTADILSAAEARDALLSASATSADSLTTSELYQSYGTWAAQLQDTVTTTDASDAGSSSGLQTQADVLSIAESQSSVGSFVADGSDTLTASDSTSSTATLVSSLIDSLGLADQGFVAGSTFTASQADALSTVDVVSSTKAAQAGTADVLSTTDQLVAFLDGSGDPGGGEIIDPNLVPKSRWVVFDGGTRLVVFSGTKHVVVFEGTKRTIVFDGTTRIVEF